MQEASLTKCWLCGNSMPYDTEQNVILADENSKPEDLVPIHDECALDYFAWLKRRGRELSTEKPWSAKAREWFRTVDKEYRSEFQTRKD